MKFVCITVAACALVATQSSRDTTENHAHIATARQAVPLDVGLGETCGIFVSSTGNDSAGCGLDPLSACLTINHGIIRAQSEGLSCVFIQAGVYNEVVRLLSGIHLQGGYNRRWQYDSYTLPAHAVRIVGGVDPISLRYMAIRAANLNAPTRMANLIVQGPNAAGGVDRSTYAVYALNSNRLVLEQVQVEAGNGAHGLNGSNGTDAPFIAMNGQNGAPGLAPGVCNASTRGAGGPPGTNVCGGPTTSGGIGGQGGTANSNCPFGLSSTAGLPGAGGQGFNPGQGGGGGPVCGPGGMGIPGANGNNGSPGFGANSDGVVGGFWSASNGGTGGTGTNGSGGGGGGGAGGCNTTHYGAGGGGGGAGGCAGTGGGGGIGAGSSFGIFAVNSIVQVEDVDIIRGIGGNGGAGGIGGRGQLGGIGGSGGPTGGGGSPGGNGGNGGHGGHGGGGGGGVGGNSFGIFCDSSEISTVNVTYSGGAPGVGGNGGASAPGGHAPPGNPGQNGANGVLLTAVTCKPASIVAVDACDPLPCINGGGGECLGDLNNDGVVDVSDLLLLLGNWGVCD